MGSRTTTYANSAHMITSQKSTWAVRRRRTGVGRAPRDGRKVTGRHQGLAGSKNTHVCALSPLPSLTAGQLWRSTLQRAAVRLDCSEDFACVPTISRWPHSFPAFASAPPVQSRALDLLATSSGRHRIVPCARLSAVTIRSVCWQVGWKRLIRVISEREAGSRMRGGAPSGAAEAASGPSCVPGLCS